MKPLVLVLASLLSVNAFASLDIRMGARTTPVIPAPATSCLAVRQAGTNIPTPDISASYIRIPHITFTKKNPANDMWISQIKITMTVPGASSAYECKVAGDALSALSDSATWWGGSITHDRLIPAGVASLTTSCPLYCGGLFSGSQYAATALMEVIGYEQAPNSDQQTAVRAESRINVINN